LVNQEAYSLFLSNAITFNAGYVGNHIRVNLNAPFAETRLYGLYLVDKQQHCDNQIKVSHNATDCKSFQLYKGILDDEAKAGFHGHVVVQPDAQRTNAYQTNRNILLTDKAVVNTKPFLEIYADDVQCSHGATVGRLDEDELFYMRTRGITADEARLLQQMAFAYEVLERITSSELRERVLSLVEGRLRGDFATCKGCTKNCC
jgi:Fe-S cluster assembly protein SufD